MTVSELIERLGKLNPDERVLLPIYVLDRTWSETTRFGLKDIDHVEVGAYVVLTTEQTEIE